MSAPGQEQLVNAASSVPFITVLGVNFMTFNETLEAATLLIGFITGVISLAFQIRRYIRSRKRDKATAEVQSDDES